MPGSLLIGLITFVIAFVYQAVLMVLLATTTGTELQPLNAPVFAAIAIIDAAIAVAAAWTAGALEQRFGRADRLTW